jgi:hypothetical protein
MNPVYPLVPCGEHAALSTSAAAAPFKSQFEAEVGGVVPAGARRAIGDPKDFRRVRAVRLRCRGLTAAMHFVSSVRLGRAP